MEQVLPSLTHTACLVYPEDTLVPGRTFEEITILRLSSKGSKNFIQRSAPAPFARTIPWLHSEEGVATDSELTASS